MAKAFQGLGFISGTNAERLAHTVGVAEAGTQWFETDTSAVYVWSGSAWFQSIYSGLTPAGGDLTGSYPNPTITNITNAPIHNSNTTLSFRTSSTERMSIDASGRMRKPFQPVCQLYNQTARGAGTPITWTGTYVNTGSMWNGATRVTVPIAGTYLVTFEGMSDNVGGAIFVDVYKNGSWMGTVRQYEYIASSIGHKHIALHVYVLLAANDYIEWVPGGNNMYADPNGYMHASVALFA